MGDNASNNDGETIAGLSLALGTELSGEHRIRCGGHTQQIVVKVVIYGQGVSQLEAKLAQAAPRDQFELFRKQGVVGK